jgi:thiol-disulfide isomerase/thioredoxin
MRFLFTLWGLLLITGCSSKENLNGHWKLLVKLQDQELPVLIQLKQEKKLLIGTLYNSSEKIKLSGSIDKNIFTLSIGTTDAILTGKVKDSKINGHWVRTKRKDYKVPFSGLKTTSESLFKPYQSKQNLMNVSGKWKINLGKDRIGLGVFLQKGSRISGSILTNSGDMRFLDGHILKDKAFLYGFDGVFSFVINFHFSYEKFEAKMHAGKSYNTSITGARDDLFELADPLTLTKLTSKEPLHLKLKDINGAQVHFNEGVLKGKVKIVQLFGSWCPNCIDESHFFIQWRKDHAAKLNDVEIIAVAYENYATELKAIKELRKLRMKLSLEYPLVIGDFKSTKTVTDLFPIDKTRAFPTTLYLNRKNEVVKIHTGFNGQATGQYFLSFQEQFNQIIDDLIKE